MTLTPENLTRALADLTRLRILMLLGPSGERCVCEFTAALDLPQPKISRHLAVLREAGILLDSLPSPSRSARLGPGCIFRHRPWLRRSEPLRC